MRFISYGLLMLAAAAAPAYAAEPAVNGTRISLASSASEAVPNDEVVVSYRIEAKGSNARQLQQQVNAVAGKVNERLKREQVKHSTTNRTLTPVWDSGLFSTKQWEMRQSGRIETQDIDAVAGWLSDIETAGAKLAGLQFQVSDKLRKQVEDRLRSRAIADFRAKAASIAAALAARTFRIINMNTSTAGDMRPRQMRQDYMAKTLSSGPALSAGESRCSVSVTGSIETAFRDFPTK